MPARGPYAKTPAKRAEILDAALELIARRGYGSASIQQIADAVGLTKAGVLHHFGSREALLLAVIARRDEVDRLEPGHEPIAGFVNIIRHNATVPGLVALFSAMSGEPTFDPLRREFFEHRYDETMRPIIDAVRSEQEAGRLRPQPDPETVARLLFALADGLQTQWLLDRGIDMAADVETFLALLRPPGYVPEAATDADQAPEDAQDVATPDDTVHDDIGHEAAALDDDECDGAPQAIEATIASTVTANPQA